MENNKKHVVVIGSGLVGSLVTIFMAKRGYTVEVFEKRIDPRKATAIKGRSINLSLSNRARNALKQVNLDTKVLEASVQMKGRLLHTVSGETKSIIYDPVNKQTLYSISRNYLNIMLIDALEEYKNIKIFFNHKLISADVEKGEILMKNLETEEILKRCPNLIIAADGAYSRVRRDIQKHSLFTFSQNYIEHGYLELSINSKNGAKMIPNHLHIWPRGEFMMIALPNLDNSYTVTLFMPFKIFNSLSDQKSLISFFKTTFPDFFNFTNEETLIKDFFRNKPMPLVSIKCNPYNFGKFLLIGDAAHAMVPFYGQGMNAGFEDCFILNSLLDKYGDDINQSIEAFSEVRKDDAHAICELAMYNYVEMRDLVTKLNYKIRKRFDEFMFKILPEFWVPLYNSVTFTNMGYRECLENRAWQDAVLEQVFILLGALLLVILSVFIILI